MKKLILPLLICSSFANASGLLLQEAVTANAGTAGAGDGVYTGTATASWTNPATMSHMGESKTTVNIMALYLQMDYTDYQADTSVINTPDGNASANTLMPSIGIFHVQQVSEKTHVGVNFGAVGGSSIEYGDNWDGANHLDKAFMSALQLNPNISYQLDDNWSVAAGVQVNYGMIEVSTTGFQSDMGTDWAFGYNFGAMYKAQKWSLGLSYRSKLAHDFDDISADLSNGSSAVVGTELVVPAIIDLSVSYDLNTDLTLLSSVQFHQWSEFSDTPVYNDTLNSQPNLPQSIDRDWDDVWKFSVGADYQVNSDWALKAGFSYETSPQDDPTKQWVDLPVGEQYRYSMGASTHWGTTRIDIFYEYADFGTMEIDRTEKAYTQIYGNFEGSIHFIGINATY
ncbi:OmpP1/FadL family transporter [Vibrio gallaecicus]|uniref:OmpP1/FadL family transporter n=1 Tax=Vibrio gallaecicus TaxID=552386 RepID=UPI0010CA18B4|nr:outer membrane protein transport protein [Vibrio gallaecicus]MDN3614647.1 outer membrane protein transport protein [Vibrio gallaecicus]MDN3615922.1 outer membrane protein transport protein [Vibrio gallaecicus]MDN3615947.1 outer membrane protein transport protein [Vibrio gallaecicus]